MEYEKFRGLVAAPFAPMKDDGKLNMGLIEKYFRFLDYNGVSGVFINGSTGEGVSLTLAERKEVVSAWTDAGKENGALRIINLTGGTSLNECVELAKYSVEKGVYAIALMAPFFFKPCSITTLGSFIGEVAKEVPGTPVYFYHIPALTGVHFRMTELLNYVHERIPNFAGIKYTWEDMADFFSCLNFDNGTYDILWGRDETLLSALALGAEGAVGSTYNYAAPLYRSIIDCYRKGDMEQARYLQLKSIEMVNLLGKYGGIGAGKAFMHYTGIDCGQFRLPVDPMSEKDYIRFSNDVDALGIAYLLSKNPPKRL